MHTLTESWVLYDRHTTVTLLVIVFSSSARNTTTAVVLPGTWYTVVRQHTYTSVVKIADNPCSVDSYPLEFYFWMPSRTRYRVYLPLGNAEPLVAMTPMDV